METKKFTDLFEYVSDEEGTIINKVPLHMGETKMKIMRINGGIIFGVPHNKLKDKIFIGETKDDGFHIQQIK